MTWRQLALVMRSLSFELSGRMSWSHCAENCSGGVTHKSVAVTGNATGQCPGFAISELSLLPAVARNSCHFSVVSCAVPVAAMGRSRVSNI